MHVQSKLGNKMEEIEFEIAKKKRDLYIFRYKCNKILFKAEIFICEKREQHINNERKREHNNKIINKEIIPQTVL